MAKKMAKSSEELLKGLVSIHVPEEYLRYFDFYEVNNKSDCYEIVLVEKENLVPEKLKGKDIVLDGYCNPLSILSHSFSLKQIFLIVKRRRWKEKNTDIHYSNEYDLGANGAKITPEYRDFLKGVNRVFPSKRKYDSKMF